MENIKITEVESKASSNKKPETKHKTTANSRENNSNKPAKTESKQTSKPSTEKQPATEITNKNPEKKPKQKHTGKDFINWISKGISDGSLPVNIQNALIHTIGENKDLILVSPVIFRKYANQNTTTYQQVQHDFQSLNLHKITPQNQNIWKFKTISKRKNKKGNTLNGMLIERAEDKLGIRLPAGNMHLKQL